MINARIPPRLEQKLAEYCTKHGMTRSEAVLRALDQYLDAQTGGPNPYSLAADLIPPKGAKELQSGKARDLARAALGGKRAR